MIIIKAGGSAITDKSSEDTPRRDVMERIADQLQEVGSVILVHGGGSFGHFPAREYNLANGYRSPDQIKGFSKTKEKMEILNNIFIDILNKKVNAVPIQSSACIITKNKEISTFFSDPIKKAVDLGMIPVLYGDTVFDKKIGFCILSGDRIIYELSRVFSPEKVIFGTDVDGIYSKNPKEFPEAELIKELSLREFSAEIADTNDVTGGMKGKLREIRRIVDQGIEVDIINITEEGRITASLHNECIGTTVIP
ncbi:MAG: isopentenyl phosphate kinase [Euryarchaeota archaeon]|nr:isopentenyl phosphate kinase [Euryarchaeota archaeon]